MDATKTTETAETLHTAGWTAYFARAKRSENPYISDDDLRRGWTTGWDRACCADSGRTGRLVLVESGAMTVAQAAKAFTRQVIGAAA